MSDVESSEAPPSLLPQFSADVSTSDDDKALQAIWEKNNSPMEELRNPAMPETFAAAEGDHVKAAWEWNQLPLEDRQVAAFVHRDNADIKKQAQALGVKVESMSDLKAARDLLSGKDKQQPAIDQDMQASLDVYKTIVPGAKDHREASQYLSGLVEHVQRDPVGGSRAVLESLGISNPLALLTPQEWQQAREHLMGTQPQQPQQSPEDGIVTAWVGERGLSMDDRRAMAEIISGPTWREIAGESDQSTLDRAYKALQRSQSRNGNSNRRVNATLDRTLRGMV